MESCDAVRMVNEIVRKLVRPEKCTPLLNARNLDSKIYHDIDFSDHDLNGLDFRGSVFINCIFPQTINNCNFNRCHFNNCQMPQNLTKCSLIGSYLNSNCHHSQFMGCNFEFAHLSGAVGFHADNKQNHNLHFQPKATERSITSPATIKDLGNKLFAKLRNFFLILHNDEHVRSSITRAGKTSAASDNTPTTITPPQHHEMIAKFVEQSQHSFHIKGSENLRQKRLQNHR